MTDTTPHCLADAIDATVRGWAEQVETRMALSALTDVIAGIAIDCGTTPSRDKEFAESVRDNLRKSLTRIRKTKAA